MSSENFWHALKVLCCWEGFLFYITGSYRYVQNQNICIPYNFLIALIILLNKEQMLRKLQNYCFDATMLLNITLFALPWSTRTAKI